ncbi:MAG: succinate dehydrogenase, cytochrome b556 subunit [Burkholderiaceae bacterium]
MPETIAKKRPEFRNIHITQILGYRLPLAGVMSILHRVSGAVMFLLLPLIVWLLDKSLTSELSYAELLGFVDSVPAKLLLCAIAWAFIHHFWGGIRHLVNDVHIGISREASPKMASIFMVLSLLTNLLAFLAIFGVI